MKATTIVGYTFQADEYCPTCIGAVLPTRDGQAWEGWAVADGVIITPEENLSEIATAFGIDRMDESSFDSSEFPKVIFACQADTDDRCGRCGEPLII